VFRADWFRTVWFRPVTAPAASRQT